MYVIIFGGVIWIPSIWFAIFWRQPASMSADVFVCVCVNILLVTCNVRMFFYIFFVKYFERFPLFAVQ